MTNKQIKIEDYFNIMRDDYGRIYGIQDIGDTKELIKAIREQNEYIQECEELKGVNTSLVHLLEYEFNRIIKLRKCLQEVKELAEAITNGTHFSDDVEEHLKEMVNKILEKINEVEDENKL